MKMGNYPRLGALVAKTQAIVSGYADDPLSWEYGYFPDPTPACEQEVRRAGFANLHHFRAVVLRRTNARWAHVNLWV